MITASLSHRYLSTQTSRMRTTTGHGRLKLPIHGTIAMRRARQVGEDLTEVERQQRARFGHQDAVKYGPLRDVDTTFSEVNWGASTQHRSRMARINYGEPVSPKTKPRVEQMSLKEFNRAFGVEKLSHKQQECAPISTNETVSGVWQFGKDPDPRSRWYTLASLRRSRATV